MSLSFARSHDTDYLPEHVYGVHGKVRHTDLNVRIRWNISGELLSDRQLSIRIVYQGGPVHQ